MKGRETNEGPGNERRALPGLKGERAKSRGDNRGVKAPDCIGRFARCTGWGGHRGFAGDGARFKGARFGWRSFVFFISWKS